MSNTAGQARRRASGNSLSMYLRTGSRTRVDSVVWGAGVSWALCSCRGFLYVELVKIAWVAPRMIDRSRERGVEGIRSETFGGLRAAENSNLQNNTGSRR